MKKNIVILVAFLAIASVQAADVWCINWSLNGGWAYSPATDNEDAGVLDDFNITWSLINADTGLVLANAVMEAAIGGTPSFNDTANGGKSATFLGDLEIASGTPVWYGSDNDGDDHYVYQRIYAWNDNEAWEWTSSPVLIQAADSTKVPAPTAQDLALGEVIIGRSDFAHNSEANTYWTKASDPSAVPEPATLSLLGLGALAMVVRRKVRK